MVNCIRELVLEGNAVKIPNLAIFSAGITTRAAEAADEFSPSKNIKSVHLRARSTGDLTRAVLTAAAKVTRADTYDPSANAIEDETGTETETPTDPNRSTRKKKPHPPPLSKGEREPHPQPLSEGEGSEMLQETIYPLH